jgi:DNA topoisomerase IB
MAGAQELAGLISRTFALSPEQERRLRYAAQSPLYINRPLTNADALIAWAKANGFTTTLPAEDLHVTVAYSKAPVDWQEIGRDASAYVSGGGPRSLKRFGDAVVLCFWAPHLVARWQAIIDSGGSWDHAEYQPHVTISYSADDIDIDGIAPFDGDLRFGPEELEEIVEDWADRIIEHDTKAWDETKHKRRPKGDDRGGEFTDKDELVPIEEADEETVARVKALKLPPAWTKVAVSLDPNAALQATGYDAKGRKQYVYSAEHSASQAALKFERLRAFAAAAPAIEKAALRDMKGNDSAAVVYLISQTGFRLGSERETGADVTAYGASTLLGKHVTVEGDTVTFSFVGKKGVSITKNVTNKNLAALFSRKQIGPDDKWFNVSEASVRDYLKANSSDAFKVKDFRTLHGTSRALELIRDEMKVPPKTVREHKKAMARVKAGVADHLGNTPAVAHASYIDPAVWGRLEVVK